MIIDRIPVITLFCVPPWRGTVMMTTPHNMVQSKRSHIVDQCFVRSNHEPDKRADCFRIIGQRHPGPLPGYLPRHEIGIPGQATEGIPVRLREVMAAPIAVRTGVCHAGNRSEERRVGKECRSQTAYEMPK